MTESRIQLKSVFKVTQRLKRAFTCIQYLCEEYFNNLVKYQDRYYQKQRKIRKQKKKKLKRKLRKQRRKAKMEKQIEENQQEKILINSKSKEEKHFHTQDAVPQKQYQDDDDKSQRLSDLIQQHLKEDESANLSAPLQKAQKSHNQVSLNYEPISQPVVPRKYQDYPIFSNQLTEQVKQENGNNKYLNLQQPIKQYNNLYDQQTSVVKEQNRENQAVIDKDYRLPQNNEYITNLNEQQVQKEDEQQQQNYHQEMRDFDQQEALLKRQQQLYEQHKRNQQAPYPKQKIKQKIHTKNKTQQHQQQPQYFPLPKKSDKKKSKKKKKQKKQQKKQEKVKQKIKQIKQQKEKTQYIQKKKMQKPKQPLTPFFIFMMTHKKIIIQQQPQIKGVELNKLLGQAWKSLNQEEKRPYQLQYQINKRVFDEQYEKYLQLYPQEKTKSRLKKQRQYRFAS